MDRKAFIDSRVLVIGGDGTAMSVQISRGQIWSVSYDGQHIKAKRNNITLWLSRVEAEKIFDIDNITQYQ